MRHKKTVWSVASVLSLALGQTVLAADLPQRPYTAPPPMIAPAPTWTGCYAGGNIGGAFGNASLSVAGPIGNGTISGNNSGFAGGGQIGCDYDFGGGWVIGFRDMFDGTTNSSSGTFPSVAFPGFAANANFNNRFDTLTARLGYAFQPAWLLYAQVAPPRSRQLRTFSSLVFKLARARTQVPWSPQTWPSVRPAVSGAPTTGTSLCPGWSVQKKR